MHYIRYDVLYAMVSMRIWPVAGILFGALMFLLRWNDQRKRGEK